MIQMKPSFVKTSIAPLVFTILIFCSCQKEVSRLHENNTQLNSTNQSINDDKKDRTILFVSNRDGNDEIYATGNRSQAPKRRRPGL